MNKENVVYIHNKVLLIHKGERNFIICRHLKLEIMLSKTKPDNERQISHAFSHVPRLSIFNKWETKFKNSLRERSNTKWERSREWRREKIEIYHASFFESSKPCPIPIWSLGLVKPKVKMCSLSSLLQAPAVRPLLPFWTFPLES